MKALHKKTGLELEVITSLDEHTKVGLSIEAMYNHVPDGVTMEWIGKTWDMSKQRIEDTGLYEAVVLDEGSINGTMSVYLDEVEPLI